MYSKEEHNRLVAAKDNAEQLSKLIERGFQFVLTGSVLHYHLCAFSNRVAEEWAKITKELNDFLQQEKVTKSMPLEAETTDLPLSTCDKVCSEKCRLDYNYIQGLLVSGGSPQLDCMRSVWCDTREEANCIACGAHIDEDE